ncbi:hypothetical protein [Streptomyces sp. NPDC048737]|uniref:hypothetical protein n=1 Tax=unclassified Streptomyces TaxID=2593676 RepID=UPI00344678CC
MPAVIHAVAATWSALWTPSPPTALADRHDKDGLVCRPDHRLPDRIQELATPH